MINGECTESEKKLLDDLKKALESLLFTWAEYRQMCFTVFVNHIRDEAYSDAQKRGFHQNEVPGKPTIEQIDEFTRKMSNEVHELWESARKSVDEPVPSKVPGLSIVEEEAADIFLGILETSKTLGIDIAYATLKKMEYNKTRGYLNGKGI